MSKSYFNMKFDEFKDKFSSFFVHKKKAKAIERFIDVAPIDRRLANSMYNYLDHLNILLETEFLDDIEEQYLAARLGQLEFDALTWAHKTKWVKAEMNRLQSQRPKPLYEQDTFIKQAPVGALVQFMKTKTKQPERRI
jgi:hypothetical protein